MGTREAGCPPRSRAASQCFKRRTLLDSWSPSGTAGTSSIPAFAQCSAPMSADTLSTPSSDPNHNTAALQEEREEVTFCLETYLITWDKSLPP